MVAFYRLHISCAILVIHLINSSHQGDPSVDPKSTWETVEKGWPLPDVTNPKGQFVYSKTKDQFKVTISPETIAKIMQDSPEMIKVTFKYWQHFSGSVKVQSLVDLEPNVVDSIWERYKPFTEKQWMSLEYFLSKDQLNTFDIHLIPTDQSLLAFKDFKIEYEYITTPSQSFATFTDDVTTKCDQYDFQKDTSKSPYSFSVDKKCISVNVKIEQDKDYVVQIIPESIVTEPTTVVVRASAVDDKTRDIILRLLPKVNEQKDMSFNLKHHLAYFNGQISLHFEIYTESNALKPPFKINIEQSPSSDLKAPTLENTHKFLLAMKADMEKPRDLQYQTNANDESTKIRWTKQWIETQNVHSGIFTLVEDGRVEIRAHTKTKHPTNEFLVSEWIQYNAKLHNKPMRYSIEVDDTEMFNAFTLRPKVCDELAHCVDVFITSLTSLDKKRTISFKFPTFRWAKFIKLIFELEYYQQAYIQDDDPEQMGSIKANLILEHFGDPCTIDTTDVCIINPKNSQGSCRSDPTNSEPNENSCVCSSGFQKSDDGLCKDINPCTTKATDGPNKGHSGDYFCIGTKTNPHKNGECIPELNTPRFKCACNDETNPNKVYWDIKTNQCEEISPDPKWNLDPNSHYYPEKTDSIMKFDLSKVDLDNARYCFNFQYMTTVDFVTLTVNHIASNTQNTFTYPLPKSATPSDYKICTDDFIYKLPTGSVFQFTADRVNKPDEFYISDISITKEMLPKTEKLIKYINWKEKKNIAWDVFGASNPSISENGFTLTIDDGVQYQVLLLSKWIESDKDIQQKLSSIEGEIKGLKVSAQAFYVNNANYQVQHPSLEVKFDDKGPANLVGLPHENVPYKLLIKIEGKGDTNSKVNIKNVVIGNACSYSNGTKYCLNNGKCTMSDASGMATCDCDFPNTKITGDKCQYKPCDKVDAQNACTNFPGLEQVTCFQMENKAEQCKCMDGYFAFANSRCSRSSSYVIKPLGCNSDDDCKILSGMDGHQKWSNKKLPTIIKDYHDVPVYYTTGKDEKLILNLKDAKEGKDMCFTIKYFASDSVINIAYNDKNGLQLANTMSDEDWRYQDICLFDLTRVVEATSTLTITSVVKEKSIVALHIANNDKIVKKFQNSIDFMEIDKSSVDNNGVTQDYWTNSIPTSIQDNKYNYWTFGSKTIDFEVPKHTNNINDNKIFSSTLLSTWIEHTPGMVLRLTSLNKNLQNVAFSAYVLDTNLKNYTIKDVYGDKEFDNKVVMEFAIPDVPSAFRVALVATYNTNITDKVTLTQISLGDACVENSIKNELDSVCNNNPCLRIKPVTGSQCKCDRKYTGDVCENKNWCDNYWQELNGDNGNQFCSKTTSGKCHIVNHQFFICDCNNNTDLFFDNAPALLERKCKPVPKCLTHKCTGEGQVCAEPTTAGQEAICNCDDAYVNLNANDTANPQCVLYNPCLEEHRKAQGKGAVDVCQSNVVKGITCQPVGKKQKCVCPSNYHDTSPGDYSGVSCVENDKCNYFNNDCEQHCTNKQCSCGDNNIYDNKDGKCVFKTGQNCDKCKNGQFCDKGGVCNCKDDFKYNTTSNACEADQDAIQNEVKAAKWACPTGLVTKNGKGGFDCNCGPGYKWANNQCVYQPLCSSNTDARKKCSDIKAMCVIDDKNNSPVCVCPPGMIDIDNNKTSITKCVNHCEYGDREHICDVFHAVCDPTKGIALNELDFDKNIPSKLPAFCRCKPGTYLKDNFCRVGDNIFKFNLELQDMSPSTTSRALQSVQVFLTKSDTTDTKDSDYITGVATEKPNYANVYDIPNFMAEIRSTESENRKLIEAHQSDVGPVSKQNANIKIMKDLLGLLYPTVPAVQLDTLTVTGCKDNNCEYLVDLPRKPKDLPDVLNDFFCKNIPGDKDSCFVNLQSTSALFDTPPPRYIKVSKPSLATAKFNLVNGCDLKDNVCTKGLNSFCVADPSNNSPSKYKCDCNTKYFTKTPKSTNFGVDVFDCPQKDSDSICHDQLPNCKPNGDCVISSPTLQNKEISVTASCYCKSGHKWDEKQAQCVDACGDQKCNGHGTCSPTGLNGWQCVCNEGYYGDSCNSEYTFSKAGWIAGIVVLAVLVVVISGVAYMFARRKSPRNSVTLREFRRSRSNGDSYSGNMGMNDYPVARSGAQSRGQSNPSFHRD